MTFLQKFLIQKNRYLIRDAASCGELDPQRLKNYTIDQNLPLEDYPSHYCRYECDLEGAFRVRPVPVQLEFGVLKHQQPYQANKSAEIHLLNCFSSTNNKNKIELFENKNKMDEFADIDISPKWQDYMSLQKDNIRWVRINGRKVTELLISKFETIKQHAQDCYDVVSGNRMKYLEAAFIEKMSGLIEDAVSICDFYRQTNFPWCALGKIVKIKSNVGQVTEIINNGSKFIIRSILTGKQQTFVVFHMKNICDENSSS